jgi:hypothetical protein
MFGMLFSPFITKWSGASLYGINMLYYDSLSSYGLLFLRPFRFRISSCPMVLFRLIGLLCEGGSEDVDHFFFLLSYLSTHLV